MDNVFELILIKQYWLGNDEVVDQPNGCPEDTTSHGKISLRINGVEISGCENKDVDYGINQSAVKLLQSVFIDHNIVIDKIGHRSPMFFHGCSVLGTCPNCIIDFKVKHHWDNQVEISDFYVSGGNEKADCERFAKMNVKLSNVDYAKQVFIFAEKAFAFLPNEKNAGKDLEFESTVYLQLKNEHEALMSLVEEYITKQKITSAMRKRANAYPVIG